MWIRYTSSGESGLTNDASDSGIRVNGGRGPDSDRGVDASDDAFEGIALVLPARRADLAILLSLALVPVPCCLLSVFFRSLVVDLFVPCLSLTLCFKYFVSSFVSHQSSNETKLKPYIYTSRALL